VVTQRTGEASDMRIIGRYLPASNYVGLVREIFFVFSFNSSSVMFVQ
jgi:hypothetical protein